MLKSPVSPSAHRRKPFPEPSKFWHQPTSLLLIVLLALTAPLIPTPFHDTQWHGLQTLIVEVGTVLLLAGVVCRPWSATALRDWLDWARHPPQIFLGLFLVWEIISAWRGPDWRFAVQGFLPMAGGVLVAWVVAAQARALPQLLALLDGLIGAALLVPLAGFALYGSTSATGFVGTFNDHQLLGAFLLPFIPLSLAMYLAQKSTTRKMFAQAAFIMCLIALLVAQTRSSWIGAVIALPIFALLTIYAGIPLHIKAGIVSHRGLRQTGFTLLLVMIATALVLWSLPNRDRISSRLQTVTNIAQGKDSSTDWRLSVWKGAAMMIEQKPILGWGLGAFALRHQPYTQTGHPTAVVLWDGPSLEDEAHNSYLQIWLESGLPGLLLWIGLLISAFVAGVRALRRFPLKSLEQYVLIGSLAAVVGQSVDALANPAWQFGDVAFYFWIILGVILALATPKSHSLPTPSPSPGIENRFWTKLGMVLRVCVSLALSALLLRVIALSAFALPAPHL